MTTTQLIGLEENTKERTKGRHRWQNNCRYRREGKNQMRYFGRKRMWEWKNKTRSRTASDGAGLFSPLFWHRWGISAERCERGVIKQPNEFVALLKTVFKWSPGFVVEKSSLSEMSKKFLTEQLSQHVKLLRLKKWFGFFSSFHKVLRNKSPPNTPSLSNLPWQGPSGWGVRMDREGFARGL